MRPIDPHSAVIDDGVEYSIVHAIGENHGYSTLRSDQAATGASPAVREQLLNRAALERDLLSLYELLLATRIELFDGAVPPGGELTLSSGELDCVVAQLDSAIIALRHMVSSTVWLPEDGEPEESVRVFDIRAACGTRAL